MDAKNRNKAIKNLKAELKKIETNKFNFMFFVFDTKGTPNGELSYIYSMALCLKSLGYNVKMLHNEKEFVGVKEWLGEKYSNLPHFNVETDGVAISPSDFLIIPEIFSNVMFQTFNKKLPCKRIALLRNYGYLTEMVQPGVTWDNYGIQDCIVATNELKDKLNVIFPFVKHSHVINPFVDKAFFEKTDEMYPKKLIFNIIANNKNDVNSIVKEFFWRYPSYKWVAFREIKNLSTELLSNALKESFATIWVDEKTDFGATALAAMASNNIIIGKIPESPTEWVMKDDELQNNALWVYRKDDMFEIIADLTQSFLHNQIPEKIYNEMQNTAKAYSYTKFKNNVQTTYSSIVEERKNELKTLLNIANKNTEE